MPQIAPTRIELGDAQPLAAGRNRFVFQHPQHSDRLIKVFHALRTNGSSAWPWQRTQEQKALDRELQEYRSLKRKNLHDLPFIQRIYGEVQTDKGFGIVVEKLCGSDGQLAPTVTDLVLQNGFDGRLRDLMMGLRDEVIEHNIIFTDVKGGNIVLAHDRHGERLVIIDGLGDRLWLPVNAMFAAVNRMNRRRHFDRALNWLENSTPEALKRGIIDLS